MMKLHTLALNREYFYNCHTIFSTGQTCVDIKDNVVNEGYYFTPKGDDPCLSCTCHDGEPEMCVAALCERPQGCQHFRKDPKECCRFTCLDPGKKISPIHNETFHFISYRFKSKLVNHFVGPLVKCPAITTRWSCSLCVHSIGHFIPQIFLLLWS